MKARWLSHRSIEKRLIVKGSLVLLTPAHFGNGESDSVMDMPISRDPLSGMPLLTGASLAGAMRNYVREWELGDGKKEPSAGSLASKLFGNMGGDKESLESYLLIDDALAQTDMTELRDSVSIDPKTRTAAAGKLFNIEVLQAGTAFELCVELLLPGADAEEHQPAAAALIQALAVALTGLERGEIGLGMRKRRGLGECKVTEWRVETFNLRQPRELVSWLEGTGVPKTGKNIAALLGATLPDDHRSRFVLDALFSLEGSLLIRSGTGKPNAPDMVHLSSKRNGKDSPILPGTSIAGVLRARATRIADLLGNPRIVDEVFGPHDDKQEKHASRVMIRETEITGGVDMVQNRVKIDRFTGGTYPGALFDQQPVFGGKGTQVRIHIEMRECKDEYIGLWMLLLKDLWTGDLPIGGEASVGRGRLRGISAKFTLPDRSAFELQETKDGKLNFSKEQRDIFQTYVNALNHGGAR